MRNFMVLWALIICTSGCSEPGLPSVGRTSGDVSMALLMQYDTKNDCYKFMKNVSFEAPFADGMAFNQSTCLAKDKKVGRKTAQELASMHVSMTSDGEYYIIKNGY